MNNIFHDDNRKVLPTLDDESIDLVITSPPYKDVDNFSTELMAVFGIV